LYSLGLPWPRPRGSALLGGVGTDAAHIAAPMATAPGPALVAAA
jgi:hypothetical protein